MRNKGHSPSRNQGFSLVELLVITAIVAILAAIAWALLAGSVKAAAKRTQLKSDIHQALTAINLYRGDNDGGLPKNWKSFGYYKVAPKGSYGGGYPLADTYMDKIPSYDVSYQTPECAHPPKANLTFLMSQIAVSQFLSRPRANSLDVDQDQAVVFAPACLANSKTERKIKIMQAGRVHVTEGTDYRSLGGNLSGSISFQYGGDWFAECAVGF